MILQTFQTAHHVHYDGPTFLTVSERFFVSDLKKVKNGLKRSWNVQGRSSNAKEHIGTFELKRSNALERIIGNVHSTSRLRFKTRKINCTKSEQL
jgi:hypothetical protein